MEFSVVAPLEKPPKPSYRHAAIIMCGFRHPSAPVTSGILLSAKTFEVYSIEGQVSHVFEASGSGGKIVIKME
jgi:hypothetical protein